MRLRPYQQAALDGIRQAFDADAATAALVVLPTGTGKTIVFAQAIAERPEGTRALVLAHREELIWQAAQKIEAVAGERPEIEMAEFQAGTRLLDTGVVVSSIQTQNAGERGKGRMTRFNPHDFSLVVVDEAHHATAKSYRRVIDYYRQNPACRILGVTATPDRNDEEALGQIFDTVAYDYEIIDAIHDGWLTPITQRAVAVDGLDFSGIRTTAGDLNGADLARVMEYEEALHGIATPTIELAAGRKTLVFAASVAHAERLTEIFNRHAPGCAEFVTGKTPKDRRRQIFQAYADGDLQILVNVGVATEGFDEPGIQVVAMARATKSRSLYAQMAGRGTRSLPGLVDAHDTAEARRAAIVASDKPACEIIDFFGNAGRHKLISAGDILGGRHSDDVVERAKAAAQAAGGAPVDVEKALFEAEQDELAEREARELREAARRAKLKAKASYRTTSSDPFDIFAIEPERERAWHKGRPPSEAQLALLDKNGITTADVTTFTAAHQLIDTIMQRRSDDRCSFKQARLLKRYGYPADVSRPEAKRMIDAIAGNGWKRPTDLASPSADRPVAQAGPPPTAATAPIDPPPVMF